jgi:hypothetical protein
VSAQQGSLGHQILLSCTFRRGSDSSWVRPSRPFNFWFPSTILHGILSSVCFWLWPEAWRRWFTHWLSALFEWSPRVPLVINVDHDLRSPIILAVLTAYSVRPKTMWACNAQLLAVRAYELQHFQANLFGASRELLMVHSPVTHCWQCKSWA